MKLIGCIGRSAKVQMLKGIYHRHRVKKIAYIRILLIVLGNFTIKIFILIENFERPHGCLRSN